MWERYLDRKCCRTPFSGQILHACVAFVSSRTYSFLIRLLTDTGPNALRASAFTCSVHVERCQVIVALFFCHFQRRSMSFACSTAAFTLAGVL
jgi:hypothetical protein